MRLRFRAGTPDGEILDLTDDLVVYAHDLSARCATPMPGVSARHRGAAPADGSGTRHSRPLGQGRCA